ncbi:bifunctional cobalt-precorrin-7 (C(5))-methyltransferase/cobalt-precorrin-6B (C(15))-methyltransferase [Planobispora takensis]|uniref:bifunctional cobalt-precorrin-7 (C(5))-methyltransferase/cobalt-precorrin-6B (C(15))-methyltransferase n=1 Tax=Planobispora takensis TaxID=1367882 RepID=UPI00194594B2|nr:bifunctional cobalt-precorrin-7 (C(5))-methyltransferase CbiE/decarboxylating cobalt-precorrin-6B (C(15))-methyltransferase CbiT [Planobispora takensis]
MITVVGVDGSELSAVARARLDEAVAVTGPERAFRRLGPAPVKARRLDGPLLEVVDAHLEEGEGRLVVLTEGDPGLFDVVRDLRGHGVMPEVLPALPLASRAFARAGLAWEDALVVTGERLDRVVNACRAHHKVAVLVGPGVGPAEIARELAPTTPRALIVCEDLGGPDERITHSRMGEATTRPWKDPDVVLVLDPLHRPYAPGWVAGARPGPPEWALDFDGGGLSPEVRAFVLAKIGPRLGDLVWDVGAGSGEIAVECARLGAAVVAVEREEEACVRLRRNVIAHGVKVALTRGQAPPALEPLADPDAVFVGGGGADVVEVCAARNPRVLVCALRTVEQVVTVLEILRRHGYQAEGVQIQSSRLALYPDGTHGLAAADPVFVVHSFRSRPDESKP